MERQGALVDVGQLAQQSMDHGKRLQELETQAHELAGAPFNLSSTKQLQEILFEQQKLPVIKRPRKVHRLLRKKSYRNWHWITHCQN